MRAISPMPVAVVVGLVIAVATAAAFVRSRARRAPLLRAALRALAISALVWIAVLWLELTGWQDTDGWIDCYPHCDAWHWFGALLFWTPLVVTALFLVVAALAAVQRLTAQR